MLKDREFYIDPIPMGEADKKKVSLALAKFGYSTDIRHNVLIVSYDQLRIHIKEVLKIKDIGKFCRKLFAKVDLIFLFKAWSFATRVID